MKNKNVLIVAIIAFAILAFAGIYWYQKNKREREEEILKQKQIDAVSQVVAGSSFGANLGGILTGIGGIAGAIIAGVTASQD